MPKGRKKIAPVTKATVRSKKTTSFKKQDDVRKFAWAESYTSFLMGIVVVIVAALFIISYVRQSHSTQQTSSTSTTVAAKPTGVTQVINVNPSKQKTYTVQRGDYLWTIAEKFYKSGYNWVDIARVNHLTNPGDIYAGNVLIIPNVSQKQTTISQAQQEVQIALPVITGDTYTVQKGDSLWSISVRAYGNGYKWTTISKANHLANPGLIFSGNVLSIPR